MAKARSPIDVSLVFGTNRRAPPEDLRLQAGSYGVSMSAMQFGARLMHALKVISET